MQLIFRSELLAATPEQDAARKRTLYAEDREFIGRMDKGSSCVVRSPERLWCNHQYRGYVPEVR